MPSIRLPTRRFAAVRNEFDLSQERADELITSPKAVRRSRKYAKADGNGGISIKLRKKLRKSQC
jgi:hypothetical protein